MSTRPVPVHGPACLGALAITLAACSTDGAGERRAWTVERDTVGDTIIVRTTGGSVWGDARLVEEVRIGRLDGPDEYTFGRIAAIATGPDGTLYALDQQVPALRAYAPDGTYLLDLARPGEGPGELKQPDSGLATLDDGRVLVRDPGNARITVFGPDGEHETEWRIRGSHFTTTPLYTDRAGNAYQYVWDFETAQRGFVRYDANGEPGDTIPVPIRGDDAPLLVAEHTSESGSSRSSGNVPFWPIRSTALSRDAEFLIGDPATYSIHVPRAGGILRIQLAFEPVPVLAGERDNVRERLVHSMRRTEPGWDWNGPAIPGTKPAFRHFMTDEDGRIWVHLHVRAEPIPEEEIEEPEPGSDGPPALRWREPTVFDVFDPDGTYLGRLEAPRGFATYPRPAIEGERVWAVVRDELDIPYLVRFRIESEPGRP